MSNEQQNRNDADANDGVTVRLKSTGEVVKKSASVARALVERGDAELVA